MKKIKKLIAVCLCAMMVMSVSIGANAATNADFDLYIVAGSYDYSDYEKKSWDYDYAVATYNSVNFSSGSGSVWTIVRDGTSNASQSKSVTSSTYSAKYNYLSGYGVIGEYYRLYGTVASSVGGTATLSGTWSL